MTTYTWQFTFIIGLWNRKLKLTCRSLGFLPSVLHWFWPLQIIIPDRSGSNCFRRATWRESFTSFFAWQEPFTSFFMNFITIVIFQYTWHNFKYFYSIICQKISWRSWPMSEINNKTLHMTYCFMTPGSGSQLICFLIQIRSMNRHGYSTKVICLKCPEDFDPCLKSSIKHNIWLIASWPLEVDRI